MTLCVLSGRDLRHVHHAFNAGLLGGLGEEGSSLNDPGTDGVAKVSPCDASKRRSDIILVEKITEHDFGTQPLEPLRPVVLSMGQGSDMVPAGQHLLSGCPASVPGRSGDQKCLLTHARLLLNIRCLSTSKMTIVIHIVKRRHVSPDLSPSGVNRRAHTCRYSSSRRASFSGVKSGPQFEPQPPPPLHTAVVAVPSLAVFFVLAKIPLGYLIRFRGHLANHTVVDGRAATHVLTS